jgi:HAD superfamily hydrolase (TIGR01509 family)
MRPASLRAIIFDFNGVLADDESLHFATFQRALAEENLALSKTDYYGAYQGMDERNCLAEMFRAIGAPHDPDRMQRILQRKAVLFAEAAAKEKPPLFPGAVDVVKEAGRRYRLAIASGGKREQIEWALQGTTIERDFAVIVSAEDTDIGKPEPAIYLLALKLLNGVEPWPRPLIRPQECLVVEDSLAGIRAALAAGMKVIALATTYPAHELSAANLVLPNLSRLSLKRMEALFDH